MTKEEILTQGEKKEISKIKEWEHIYREPQNFDHTKLICIGEEGDYKIFKYNNYNWGYYKVKIKKSDLVEVWYDNYRHVKWDAEVIPYEETVWEDND